jgi:two-component system, cell cycle sensor histidine kinase and response regulator CckA
VSFPENAISGNSAGANPKILVVDDEPDVLRLIESILNEEGFEVIQAKSADAAIKLYDKLGQSPDLLLTDVVMPGMSGPMLADQLLEKDPDLKVLFMSGYDDRHVVQRYVLERGFRLISKPFTVKSLRAAIHAAFKSGKKPAV